VIRSILVGLAGGQRAMTPLAAVAGAARRGDLSRDNLPGDLARHPLVAAGMVALAAAEMAGDKMKTAPDRTVAAGLIGRTVTSAYAGAALAEPGKRRLGAALAVGTALASSYAGLALRKRAMRRFGQDATGFVEDAAVLALAVGAASGGR
jgi:uncharacterized membrane protein